MFLSLSTTLTVLLAFLIALQVIIIINAQPTKHQNPNILFLLSDDLGYGELSSYGQPSFSTPNLDKLAASGMRFTDAYAGAPVCGPSRGVLMT